MYNYIGWYGSVCTFFPDSYGSEKQVFLLLNILFFYTSLHFSGYRSVQ